MCKKFVYLTTFVLVLGLSGAVQALEFYDDFNTPQDYVIYGVTGSRWDDMIGLGENETVDRLEADMNNPGQLYLQSTNARWEPPTWTLGPFLYKVVEGDFVAEVRVTDFAGNDGNEVLHNDSFILARVADLDAAGEGEDGESIHYFPTWSGNIFRDMNNGGEAELGATGDGFDCATYLRLERSGDIFRFEISFEGEVWESLDTTGSFFDVDGYCIERPDFNGLPLQVGLAHATYSGQTGYVAFDDFTLTLAAELPHPKAWAPYPRDKATDVAVDVDLMWNPGDNVQAVNGHDVFWGTNRMFVDYATRAMHMGVEYRNVSDPCCDPGILLPFGTTYYWRVDEVNGPTIVKGDIWEFTVEVPKASNPNPMDGAIGVPVDTEKLRWTPSKYAVSQDAYFSVSFDHVNTGTTPDIPGLAGDVNECNIPPEYVPLIRSQTYYWRVDSNNGEMPATKGDVWSFSTPSVEFYDDFNTPHDYVRDGVVGTGWDGFLGLGDGETIDRLEADRTTEEPCYPGQLYIQSTNSQWAPGKGVAALCGPFLYIEVAGDFIASVRVTDYPGLYDVNGDPDPNNVGVVYSNNCGVMARVGDLDAAENDPNDPNAEAGEDWVSVDFFPIWGQGNYARHCDDGTRFELLSNGWEWDADLYLQLERNGNKFHFRHSSDGKNWTYLAEIDRPDLNDLPMQVGLQHATFGNLMGYAAFDDFHLVRQEWPQARGPHPTNGATNVSITTDLGWKSGDFVQDVNGHQVYFGTDFNDINDATVPDFIVSDPCADPGLLELDTIYYWRVDEVNGPNNWKGNIWRFMTAEWIFVDDLDLYSTRDDLLTGWKDGYASWPIFASGSNIALSSEIAEDYGDPSPGPIRRGRNAMQFVYDNDGMVTHFEPGEWKVDYWADYYSEIEANISDLPALSDWTTYGVKALALSFFGRPNNDVDDVNEQMYVAVEDIYGQVAVAKYGDDTNEDVNNLRKPKWQQWNIDLMEFSGGGVDLNDVNKVYIGFGNRDNPAPGGYGIVYFDSIRLYRPRCVPGTILGDFTDDCVVDYNDLAIFVEGWLSQLESVGPNVVGQWKFDGASGTEATDSAGTNHGTILGGAALDGSGQLTLDGEDDYVELPIGSVIASLNECSFVTWVDWPGTGGSWQRIFEIGHPNEVDPNDFGASTNPEEYIFLTPSPFRCAITLGSYSTEQIVEGGTPEPDDPMPSGLHCVVVTIDVNDVNENNTILSLYLDGELAGRNTDANLAPSDLGDTPNNWLGRSLYAADPYISGSYDEFRIYDRVLPEGEIEMMYHSTILRQRSDVTGDGKVDFRDFAMLADKWLEGPILWP